jgi:predicted AlkP superfamily pyrophosphatase or phosphodiesterase
MRDTESKKLLFCYVDGIDLRRIDQTQAPFVFDMLKSKQCVRIASPPSADSLPTLLTGTYPSEHGMFGVKLKPNSAQSLLARIVDQIPDILTTTTQCIFQAVTGSYDLPAIPPKRRRRFEILRTQQNKKYRKTENLLQFGGLKSCLGAVGIERCNYQYSRTSDPLKDLIENIGSGEYIFEFVHFYGFDLLQRWNIDDVKQTKAVYAGYDKFVRSLYEKCKNNKITLLLFSDHGYDQITGYIDLFHELKKLNLSQEEYRYFVELSMARFWFFSDTARERIVEMLQGIPNSRYFSWKDLREFNISFNDPQYGEAFIFTCPGFAFFPHEFYQPVANLYLGIIDARQRSRLHNARHRGDHTLLPYFETAKGFMLVLNKDYESCKKEIDLIDVAPTILELLGVEKPNTMSGSPVFKAREHLN